MISPALFCITMPTKIKPNYVGLTLYFCCWCAGQCLALCVVTGKHLRSCTELESGIGDKHNSQIFRNDNEAVRHVVMGRENLEIYRDNYRYVEYRRAIIANRN